MLTSPLISSSEKWGLYLHRVSVKSFWITFMKSCYSIQFNSLMGTRSVRSSCFLSLWFHEAIQTVWIKELQTTESLKPHFQYWHLLLIQYCHLLDDSFFPLHPSPPPPIHLKPVCPPECFISVAIIISPLLFFKKKKVNPILEFIHSLTFSLISP